MCGPKLLRHSGQEGRKDRYAVMRPELKGIKPDKLAKPVADQLEKAFK